MPFMKFFSAEAKYSSEKNILKIMNMQESIQDLKEYQGNERTSHSSEIASN